MKNEHILDAIGLINDKVVVDAKAYKQPKSRGWLKLGVAAACLCFFFAGLFPMFNNQLGVSPFVLTAYAAENDGKLTAHVLEQNVSVPLTEIQVAEGVKCFMFSCPLGDQNELSRVVSLSEQSLPEMTTKEQYGIMEEKGLQYFCYIPTEGEDMPITFLVRINTDNGDYYRFIISINKEASGFTATLKSQTLENAD